MRRSMTDKEAMPHAARSVAQASRLCATPVPLAACPPVPSFATAGLFSPVGCLIARRTRKGGGRDARPTGSKKPCVRPPVSSAAAQASRLCATLLLTLLILFFCATAARADDIVRYHIRIDQPQTQMVDISVTVRDVSTDTIDFVLPTWRPGRYEILDTAGTIREVRAVNGDGESLDIEKIHKSAWRVKTHSAAVVTISYRVYANSITNRTRHVDDTHAFLSGSSVFMMPGDRRTRPIRVSIDAPPGWRTATGLEHDPAVPGTFIAANYDVLVDSPLEIGIHERIEFDVDGLPHEIILWGRGDYRDGEFGRERLIKDFSAIIRDQIAMFGRAPYSRYVFMVHVGPGLSGGTEHLNSTIMLTSPATFERAASYERFLGLVSHEYFHTWNVKQFRPAGIHPYDYNRENYTDLLWVVEGTTSYYDDLSLVRAGLITPTRYFRMLADAAGSLESTPGRHHQSLAESSFDAWIKFNRATPDSPNSTISFYSKGALVSLMLDLELRRRTANRASLDDVMRELFEAFPLDGPGYTTRDLLDILARRSDSDFTEFFAAFVSGVQELPLADALAVAGLKLEFEPDDDKPEQAYVGLRLSDRGGLAVVDAVLADGPAYTAGVMHGDEIIAFNGQRLRPADLDRRVEALKPGAAVRLTLIRRDELRDIEFVAGARPNGRWNLTRDRDAAEAQRAVYKSWLKQPWPGERSNDEQEDDADQP